MKILIGVLKITTLLVFGGMVFLTVFAYLNLPLPWKPLVVMSGSMEPTIKTGSLVLVDQKNAGYAKNDIITFKSGKGLVSHRVNDFVSQNGSVYFQTKGDANNNVDTSLVARKDVVGKVGLSVPYLGRFVNFVKTPLGFILLITIPIFFIIISEILVIIAELRKKGTGKTSNLEFAKPIAMFFVAAIFLTGTHAFFSSIASSSNNTFVAAASFNQNIANHLVISEVQFAGAVANDDFIELYNPTNSPISLTGHRLVKRTSSGVADESIVVFGSGDSVPAHSYLLWCNSSFVSLTCDKNSTDTLSNDNSIALRNGPLDTGTIVDAVTVGSPANPLGEGASLTVPAASSSTERKASSTSTSVTLGIGGAEEFKGNGFDTDNNSTDFVSRTLSQPQNSSSATETP